MGTDYFLYRKDNNTAFDLGRGSSAFNFGYGITNFNSQLEVIDKQSLLTWLIVSFSNKFSAELLLIRDRLLDFLEGAAKRDIIFIRDEMLGELLESNVWAIVTHDVYYTDKQITFYLEMNNIDKKEYVANPLKFYKENNISKKGD